MIVGWCALISKKHLVFFTNAGSRTFPVYYLHYFFALLIIDLNLGELLVDKMSVFGIVILAVIGFLVTCVLSFPLFDYPFIFIKSIITKICKKNRYSEIVRGEVVLLYYLRLLLCCVYGA